MENKILKDKKKIAIVYHFFAHYRGPVIEEMLNCDINDYYFVAGKDVNGSYRNLKLYEIAEKSRFLEVKNHWFFKNFLWQSSLLKTLLKGKFDCIIFLGDWKFLSTWFTILILGIKRIPSMFWSHGVRTKKDSINNKIKMFFLKSFSHGGFVYDSLAKDTMLSMGFKKPLVIIYNSLNYQLQQNIISEFKPNLETLSFIHESNYVVFTGRLESRKKLEILIEAISLLKDKNIHIGALIIGEGEIKSQLINYSKSFDVYDNIYFLGSCYDEKELANYFINALACVIPDSVGLTSIHSLTYGTPIITNDSMNLHGPEIESVKEGISGFFFKEGDASSLALKIEYLLNLSKMDRDIIKSNSREIVNEHYNPQKQIEIMNKVLENDLNWLR